MGKVVGLLLGASLISVLFLSLVQPVQATCGIKNIQISASKTTGIGEGEQITVTVEFDYQRGANEAFFDWQVKLYEDDYFGDDLMGTNSGSITEPLPLVVHITTTFTIIPSNYVDASEFGIGEIYAEVQAGWELGCIHNANSDTISIVVCSGFPDCIAYKTHVDAIAATYPDDAGPIYINSLRDYGGVDIERYSGSSLFNKIKNSNLWSSPSFKNKVNSEVIKQLQQKVEEIDCKPVDGIQNVEIFINTNELITSDVFDFGVDTELYWIFHAFKIYPHGANSITLKRVGENDYKVSGTIYLHINDRFDFDTETQYAYECQQAGCVHNFDIDVYGVDFEINDLEVTLDSSKMYCGSICCLDGCCLGECCGAGTPNAGICYSPKTEEGCCKYGEHCKDLTDEGVCTTCYSGSWNKGWHCEDGECVPEASTFVLLGFGLLCVGGYFRLKRKEN